MGDGTSRGPLPWMGRGSMVFDTIPVGKPTVTGRIYPREVIDKVLHENQQRIGRRQLLVVVQGIDGEYKMQNVAGIVTRAWVEEDMLKIEVEPVVGGTVSGLLKLGGTIRVTPYGRGTLSENVVNDDYKLHHFQINSGSPAEPAKESV